jgi:hypothetical protein
VFTTHLTGQLVARIRRLSEKLLATRTTEIWLQLAGICPDALRTSGSGPATPQWDDSPLSADQ